MLARRVAPANPQSSFRPVRAAWDAAAPSGLDARRRDAFKRRLDSGPDQPFAVGGGAAEQRRFAGA
jgi:hypothetical protein